ncbi:MAG TPA: SDR family oxidoreductase [Deltaproteobacteria bacterium]|nr:SDR family oxidoreductase [Deltaproteobacteria bacterium]
MSIPLERFGADSTAEQVTEGLDLSGTTWLVTGVSSGLGLETARVLALRGGHVVGAARTEDKARAALEQLGIEGTPVACELSEAASVRAAVSQIQALDRSLDGIIANAGIMALPELRQRHGLELQLLTNHVGHFILVTGLLDRLSEAGRVVVLSSGAHHRAEGLELDNLSGERDYQPWRMYGRSKLANILFARSLAQRLSGGRTANAVHPGVIATNLARHVPDPEALFARMRPQMKTVEQGAATQCLVATHPGLASSSGLYFSDCQPTDPSDLAQDDALAAELWARTEQLVAEL